jgi:hypothetical protein
MVIRWFFWLDRQQRSPSERCVAEKAPIRFSENKGSALIALKGPVADQLAGGSMTLSMT